VRRVVITGGGTGGHLAIAKVFKEELNARGIKPIYIGATHGQDRMWFGDDEGFSQKHFFNISGVVNKRGFKKVLSLLNIIKFSIKASRIIKGADCVISVGGYSSAPASFASIYAKVPLYIHEQNAKMGRLNALLAKRAKALFCSYDNTSPILYYPIRDLFFKHARTRKSIKHVLFLGGSQGAKAINEFALKSAKVLHDRGIKITHQCGEKHIETMQKAYAKEGIDVELFGFHKDLVLKIKEADFAISRAGASTLWELCANGLPALFIPYPYASANHQYHNAHYLLEHNLALLEEESNLRLEVWERIFALDIEHYSMAVQGVTKQGATSDIIDYIFKS
jgi:UDP-N-acetylglucosamine--N-acetylmuramyl-(pentapeptide) pyrophosphoryl-undecaprenol N-acetylglucosamine transferase